MHILLLTNLVIPVHHSWAVQRSHYHQITVSKMHGIKTKVIWMETKQHIISTMYVESFIKQSCRESHISSSSLGCHFIYFICSITSAQAQEVFARNSISFLIEFSLNVACLLCIHKILPFIAPKNILWTPCDTLGNIPYNQILKKAIFSSHRCRDTLLRSSNLSANLIPERDIIMMHCACLLSFWSCAPK